MLEQKRTRSEGDDHSGQLYVVRMGALVTGFGSHGAPCWLTRLGPEVMTLTVAKPAVLTPSRLKPGRTVVVHLSHRVDDLWRVVPMRAKIVRASGNTFTVRIVEPGPHVVMGLIRQMRAQGRAKRVSAPPDAASEPSEETITIKVKTRAVPSRETSAEGSPVAQVLGEVVKDYGAKWIATLLGRIEELLLNGMRVDRERLLQPHLHKCYQSLVPIRETLATELRQQLSAVIDDLFAPLQGGPRSAPVRGMARNLDLMGTLDLNASLAFNEAMDALVNSIAPETIVRMEQRMSRLLNTIIDERNNPLRVERIVALTLGTLFEHWYEGTSVRQIVNEALRDSTSSLCNFYDAVNAALDKLSP
jgi:hypothetical protein